MTVTFAELTQFLTALAALGAMGLGWYNAVRISQVHTATNSMKDALVAATAKASHAEGLEQGREERKQL